MKWIKVPSPSQSTGEYETILVNLEYAYMIAPSDAGYGITDIWCTGEAGNGAISTSLTVDEIHKLIKERDHVSCTE